MGLDTLFLGYFLVHLPVSLLIDAQAVLPAGWHPQVAVDLVDYYVREFRDPYMRAPPVWFQSFVWCELTLQLALQLAAIYGLLKRRSWVGTVCVVYGTHVATTVLPIVADTACRRDRTTNEKAVLLGFYVPYLLLPVAMVLRFALHPWPSAKPKQS
eukprot:comp17136_c0_seq1/m.15928 comp17136_c0_seq1/g.15928  ORF comp17136_c0_seq1/g.15928 comp17136_c0_seq1/m.15928 type:complete len:156 (-) comp17136_c0_seq1:53-520(-)